MMDRYDGLLRKISDEYDIRQGQTENESMWKARIVYSLLGQMGLSSLYDEYPEETVSITHFKSRIETIMKTYLELYPNDLGSVFLADSNDFAEEIYDVYLKTGHFYHKNFNIRCAKECSASYHGVELLRGYSPEIKHTVSGLGSYRKINNSDDPDSVVRMFQLSENDLETRWNNLITNITEWRKMQPGTDTEYLRMEPPFTYSYWVNRPYKNRGISIMRSGMKGAQIYYLYQYDGKDFFVHQLPEWQTADSAYRSLSNACLYVNGVLPPVRYRIDGDTIRVRQNYLLPPAELNLIKLYSWPDNFGNVTSPFYRIMNRDVFEMIKAILSLQGYQFEKE